MSSSTDHSPPARRSLRARSRLGRSGPALTDLALLALPLLFAYWALATQSGLRAVAAAAQWAVPSLQIEVASGSLVDTPRLARLVHDDGSLRVDARAVALDWSASALLRGRLDIARLSVDELRVATSPSDEAPVVPTSLELPLSLNAQVEIGRLVLADYLARGTEGHADGRARLDITRYGAASPAP